MTDTLANQYEPDHVSPPGETLAELLEELQMTQAHFAERIGRTAKFVNEIIKGKASITPAVAIEFQRVLGLPSSFWNNRQRYFDAFIAKQRERKELAKNLDWARSFPYAVMSKWKWVPETRNKLDRLSSLLDFFGVANPKAWDEVWKGVNVSYRRSERVVSDEFALAAWLRKGEIEARGIECQSYDRKSFLAVLNQVRELTLCNPEVFVPALREKCASCGVAVSFVPELPKTASGATRWLSPNKALIQLSLRYKSDDHLWFTFFHEAAHILFHKKKSIFIETGKYDSDQEREADQFASNLLIPQSALDSFVSTQLANRISKASIKSFGREIGIAPGIVVGRLQHDSYLKPSHCNDLKRRLVWIQTND